MKGKLFAICLGLLIIVTMLIGCGLGTDDAKCNTQPMFQDIGCLMGMIIVMGTWSFIILPVGIFLFLKFAKAQNKEGGGNEV
jgi:hypothetical protein